MSEEVKINKKTQFMRLRQFYLYFFNDLIWDLRLGIHTVFSDYRGMNRTNYGYDPTPYQVLQKLVKSGWLRKEDTLVDYGCGKGRVGFFLSYRTKAAAIGIEYDQRIYDSALENRKTARAKADFILTKAEAYDVPVNVKHCYFFNPFSVEILHKVMARILASYYENPREVFLFFFRDQRFRM